MKKCITCKIEKELTRENWYGDRTMKDGFGKRCKQCDNKRTDARKLKRTAKLKNAPCADCGKTFLPCAMSFDHIPGRPKNAEIWQLRSASVERLQEELKNCDLVCLNCHAIRTYVRSKQGL